MAPQARPFDDQVDRSGDHHLWTGARKADGTGLIRVGGKLRLARQVAWERAHGSVPEGFRITRCEVPGCVRVEHLSLAPARRQATPKPRRRAAGGGSKAELRPGVWKLTVSAGQYEDGARRREHRIVDAGGEVAATEALAAFVAEVRGRPHLERKDERDTTVDEGVDRFLHEYLRDEKGRSRRTVEGYGDLHRRWGAEAIGRKRLRDVTEEDIDALFGAMQRAGLSHSQLNQARSLYGPLFRWAKRRRIVGRNVMAEFQMPTSSYVSVERPAPEAEDVCLLLATAVQVTPEVAPLLTLAAVTGMRRGELGTIRRTDLRPRRNEVTVRTAGDGADVKATKTRRERHVSVDAQTMGMLQRHCEAMDQRADEHGFTVADDAFVFSLETDCSRPMPAHYVTKRVAVLKEHLGIEVKSPEVAAREDEALRLFRQAPAGRKPGKPGRRPAGGLSYREIGERFGRSARWASMAVASAQRREQATLRGPVDFFDGSVLGLRKFTSSELLDAGFNISAVAGRQGHGPMVLVKHYSKRRRSADERAAEHLGTVVHGG